MADNSKPDAPLLVHLFARRVDVAASHFVELRSTVDVRSTRLGGLVDTFLGEEQLSLSLPRSRVGVQLACCGPHYTEDGPPVALTDPSRSLYELGVTGTAWLLFSVAETTPGSLPATPTAQPDVVALLSQYLRQPLSAKLQHELRYNTVFAPDRAALLAGDFPTFQVSRLLHRLNNVVSTSTRRLVTDESGLVLDGPISGSGGQQTTSLVMALDGTCVRCAKVGPPRLVQHEFTVSQAVHGAGASPCVMRALGCTQLPMGESGVPRAALVMPFYAMTLADAELALAGGRSRARDVLSLNAATCGVAAVAAFSAAGWSHGDIKPQNLMLTHSGLLVAIDFGTAQKCGDAFTESSSYGLGQQQVASAAFDMVCLGATLTHVQCQLRVTDATTRAMLLRALGEVDDAPATAIARYCLSDGATLEGLVQVLRVQHGRAAELPGVILLEDVGLGAM